MNLQSVLELLKALHGAHPVGALVAAFLVGPLWPKALNLLATKGIDALIPRVLALQALYIKKLGGTDAQIKQLEAQEAQSLAAAAAKVTSDAAKPAA